MRLLMWFIEKVRKNKGLCVFGLGESESILTKKHKKHRSQTLIVNSIAVYLLANKWVNFVLIIVITSNCNSDDIYIFNLWYFSYELLGESWAGSEAPSFSSPNYLGVSRQRAQRSAALQVLCLFSRCISVSTIVLARAFTIVLTRTSVKLWSF